jgi:hypothetical protein
VKKEAQAQDRHAWRAIIDFHPCMSDHLFALMRTGLYGNSLGDVVGRLAEAEIRRLYTSGDAQRLGIRQPW